MKADLDALNRHASALYELLQDSEDREVNMHLRKLIFQLEMMDNEAADVPQCAYTLAAWLMRLCDVEHGMLVKHYTDNPNTADEICIEHHVKEQQEQLHVGEMLHTGVERGIKHLAGMLGVPGAQGVPVQRQVAWFATVLLEHLREDQKMGGKLHLLAMETMESLRAVQEMLAGLGEESPELQRVALLLSQPIPKDPEEAHDYLARVSHDLRHVQHKMIEESKQVQHNIDNRVQAFEDVSSQLSAAQEQVRSDALTGLPNRRALVDFLEAYPRQQMISMAIVDVDQLEQINAVAGEAGGNRCLCEIADILIAHVRADDMVFRFGGDSFVIMFPGVDIADASKAAQVLHGSIAQMSLSLSGHDIDVRTSFGLAEHAKDESLPVWMRRADAALYVAKGKGGNCVEAAP